MDWYQYHDVSEIEPGTPGSDWPRENNALHENHLRNLARQGPLSNRPANPPDGALWRDPNGTLSQYDAGSGSWGTIGGGGAGGQPAKIGVLGDSHYNEIGGRGLIPGGSTIKSKWDTIIDGLNAWGADAVVSTGDNADGNGAPDAATFANWSQETRDYLENRGGSDGNGLDAPLHLMMGDHESKFYNTSSGNWGIYGSSQSDTYYKVAIGTVDLVVLRGVSNSELSFSSPHTIEQEQLDWLEGTLRADARPKVVMTHLPPFDQGGNEFGKDGITNGDELTQILESAPQVSVVGYGHMHHFENVYWRTWSQRHGWLHCGPPFGVGLTQRDTSISPYTMFTVGANGSARATVNYTTQQTGLDGTWSFAPNEDRQQNPTMQQSDGVAVRQVDSTPTDYEINGGNTALYAKPGGDIYQRPFGGTETAIGNVGVLNRTPRSSPPSSPDVDDIYVDDGTNTADGSRGFRQYDGSAWVDF